MKLESCPFCGEDGENLYFTSADGRVFGSVQCGCGASGPETRTFFDCSKNAEWKKEAARLWNDRI
jgi:hypothetical protein